MKITPKEYELLKERFILAESKCPGARKHYRDKGFSVARFVWDIFHHCNLTSLYKTYNDAHIETALLKIYKETEK